ncbi:MAG TPA: ABC transporter permease [Gammaproteobacteria bacterium]|nr:ABC transporter permease [Gammaproteobacteria bacterium]
MNTSVLKVALRTLVRDKTYALINVAGLALAVACCLILGVYLRSELTYDQSHVNHERIFRIANQFDFNGKVDTFPATSVMLGPMLKDDNADVQAFVRVQGGGGGGGQRFIKHGNDGYYWDSVATVDPNIFEVFTHKILYGDPKTALVDPTSVAVSHKFAQKYFGERNPLGETINIENGSEFKITLVFDDLPENTTLKYDVLFSMTQPQFTTPDDITQRERRLYNIGLFTYLLMPEGYDARKFADVSKEFFDRHMAEMGKQLSGKWQAWLQPLDRIHLYSDLPNDISTGNRYYIYGFIAVAVFTLLVACINYMNLATARAAKRAKEVGMRKIMGSTRTALVAQFLTESVLLAVIAVTLGVALVEAAVAFTPIDQLFGKQISLAGLGSPTAVVAWIVGLALAIGLVAGLYPAFYLSSIVPVSALVSGTKGGSRNSGLREALVLLQFTISIAVIACTLLMMRQMGYVASMSLGFEKENRVIVTMRGLDLIERREAIRTELLTNPNVLAVTWSASMMGGGFPINVINLENNEGVLGSTSVIHMGVGPDFLNVMGMELLEGRAPGEQDLGQGPGPGFSAIVVNETLVKHQHWDTAIGKRFEIGPQKGTVVGVVKDFNFTSVHNEVTPFALYRINETFPNMPPQQRPFNTRTLAVKISGKDVPGTIAHIRSTFANFDKEHPFEFKFLDDSLDQLYLSDTRLTRLIAIFSGFCIFIACLGLFGLASFTTAQRTREIGVRKVLGARTSQIVTLLAQRTVVLVLIAAPLASALAFFAMTKWLGGFAYRTSMSPLPFVGAAMAGLAIAYATVALQSLKAGRAHPVKALRYE